MLEAVWESSPETRRKGGTCGVLFLYAAPHTESGTSPPSFASQMEGPNQGFGVSVCKTTQVIYSWSTKLIQRCKESTIYTLNKIYHGVTGKICTTSSSKHVRGAGNFGWRCKTFWGKKWRKSPFTFFSFLSLKNFSRKFSKAPSCFFLPALSRCKWHVTWWEFKVITLHTKFLMPPLHRWENWDPEKEKNRSRLESQAPESRDQCSFQQSITQR